MAIQYTNHDRRVAESCYMRLSNFGIVEFQFPPKILSDNRRGTWLEPELPGTEPVANYKTSGAREISLSFTYVVDSHFTQQFGFQFVPQLGNGQWSIDRIKEQTQKLRGYFTLIKLNNGDRKSMLVYFKYPFLTGKDDWTCRIKSVDVKHSETLVGEPNNIFPLRTDIIVDLRMWTTGTTESKREVQAIQDFVGLSSEPKREDLWY